MEQRMKTTAPIQELIKLANRKDLTVEFARMEGQADGLLIDKQIFIKNGMSEARTIYILAHEIAHYFLHYDKGDIINSPFRDQYEEQADRCARAILTALSQ